MVELNQRTVQQKGKDLHYAVPLIQTQIPKLQVTNQSSAGNSACSILPRTLFMVEYAPTTTIAITTKYTQTGTFRPAIIKYRYAEMKKKVAESEGNMIDFPFL